MCVCVCVCVCVLTLIVTSLNLSNFPHDLLFVCHPIPTGSRECISHSTIYRDTHSHLCDGWSSQSSGGRKVGCNICVVKSKVSY